MDFDVAVALVCSSVRFSFPTLFFFHISKIPKYLIRGENLLFICLVFSHTIHPDRTSHSPLLPLPAPICPSSIPLFLSARSPHPRKEQASQWHQPNMLLQVRIRLGTNPHIKSRQRNPVEEKGSQEQAKESETPYFPLSEVSPKHQANNHRIYAEDLAMRGLQVL